MTAPNDTYSRFELLAKWLEPRFGNIYEYNMNGGDVGWDVQEWTDELKEAVRDYLLHEIPDDVYHQLVVSDPGLPQLHLLDPGWPPKDMDKQTQVAELIAVYEPWALALEIHGAAVKIVPTLDQLIGDLKEWPSMDEREDASLWLRAHTSDEALTDMVTFSNRNVYRLDLHLRYQGDVSSIVDMLEPFELLAAWRYAVGPAPSDLTDAEWKVVEPFAPPLGTIRNQARLAATRRALNGMLYRHANNTTWYEIPLRYGKPSALQPRYSYYSNETTPGLFARMLSGVEDKPEASRIVAWLRTILKADTQQQPQPELPHQINGTAAEPEKPTADAVRSWARAKGYYVGARGRMSERLYEEYLDKR